VPNFIDRSGLRYGRLVAFTCLGRDDNKKLLWECRCDCGATTIVTSSSLGSGNTQSCGCLLQETITKHRGSGRRSYNTWRAMVRRCTNPQDKDYSNYGGRGITVCTTWLNYATFALDMGEPPNGTTLDRIDGSMGYFPLNCRWASGETQARNVRSGPNRGVRSYDTAQGRRWYAQISVGGGKKYSTVVDTLEQARDLRRELEREHWKEA
jgi:hypothetical protein